MITTSDRWKKAVRQSGERICLVDLYYNHQPLPVLTGLEVIACSITNDMNGTNRRSGSLTLANTDLLTTNTHLTLEPYGLEVGIRSGVVYPNGEQELVSCGIFPFVQTDWSDDAGSVPTLTLQDRSYSIGTQSGRLANALEDYGGQTSLFAIGDLIRKSTFHFKGVVSTKVDPTTVSAGDVYLVVDAATQAKDEKLPGGAPMQGAFWDDITQLATNLGASIYFDVDGVNLIMEQTPEMTKDVTTWDAEIGVGENGNIITASRSLSRTNVWNAVTATGALPANAASAQLPPYVFVFDSNPASKTYYYGPFGRIVNVVTSDTITTKAKLETFAKKTLAKGVGLAKSVTLTCLADPSLDVGDVLRVTFLDGSTELHMILSIEMDHVAATMSLTTLSQNQV